MTETDLFKHLGQEVKVKIDHPLGSRHSKFGFTYPVNYGYVPENIDSDDKKQDAYLLGVFEPVEEYEGRLIGIIHRDYYSDFEDVEEIVDTEEILVVAPKTYTAEQINALVEFQEWQFSSRVIKVYDKPYYWPEDFTIGMPEVQKAIKAGIKDGEFSLAKIAPILKKGYGRSTAFGFWLADNGIIEKLDKTKLGEIDTITKSKVKTYKEAIEKIKASTI